MGQFQEYALKLHHVQFHPTNRCNLKCVFCWLHNHYPLRKGITESRLKSLVRGACNLSPQFITITGGGEPLLRENLLVWMMETIKSYGIQGVLITNGTLIDESFAEKVVHMGWDDVQFSLHAPEPHLDRKIRGGIDSFSKTLEGIRLIGAWKKKSSSEKPQLAIRFVIIEENYKKISAMIPLAHSLGIDALCLKMVNEGANPFCRELSVKEEHFSQLLSQITLAQQLAGKFNLKIKLEFDISSLSGNQENPEELLRHHCKNTESPYCILPFREMVVFGNGLVSPCCNYFYLQFEDSTPTGIVENATSRSLDEIWAHGFSALREMMISNNPAEVCKNCSPDIAHHKKEAFLRDVWDNKRVP